MIVWFDTSSVPKEAVFARTTPLLVAAVQIQVVVAVAEGDQALAAAVQAHMREGGLVEAVALDHRDVDVAQRLGQFRGAVALVPDQRSPGDPDGAALLLERGGVEGLRVRGADVEDFDGLRHG